MRQKIWEKLRGDNIRGKIKAATTVEAYIAKQKSPQKEICQTLRQIILKTFPETEEEMKMGVPWYGGRCYIVALKDHVNLGVCIEGLTEKQLALLEGAGKFMRHIKIRQLDEIDEKQIVRLLRMVSK